MLDPVQINNYSSLLKIRLSAFRRNTMITGGVFLVSILATLMIGLLTGLSGRSIYLIVAMNLAFRLGFINSWVRLEVIKGSIELIDNIQH